MSKNVRTKKTTKISQSLGIPDLIKGLDVSCAEETYPVRFKTVEPGSSNSSKIDLGTQSAWNSLLCAALAFWQARPWRIVRSQPNFFFRSPFYATDCVGNIMGQACQSFGLVVFPSEAIWERYLDESEAIDFSGIEDEPTYILTQSCSWLSLDFVPWDELSPEGQALMGHTTWNDKTADGVFPDFLSHRVGYVSAIPNIGEAILLEQAIRYSLYLAGAHEAGQIPDLDMMQSMSSDNRATLVLVEKEQLTVEDVRKLLPSPEVGIIPSPCSAELDSVDMTGFDLSQYPVRPKLVWELAVERMRNARIVDPDTNAVTFPRIVVMVDAAQCYAFPPEVISLDENPVPAVLKVLMAAAEVSRFLPAEVHVKDEALKNALSPILGEYGITPVALESLPTVDGFLEMMAQEM